MNAVWSATKEICQVWPLMCPTRDRIWLALGKDREKYTFWFQAQPWQQKQLCDSIFLSLSSSSQCLLDTSNLIFCGDGFALESHLPTWKIPAFQKRSCDEPIVEALRSLQLRIQIGKIYAWMRMYTTASSDDSSFSKFVWIDKDRESLLWICGLATCVCTANYATEEMTQVGNLIHESIGPHFLLNRWGSQSKVAGGDNWAKSMENDIGRQYVSNYCPKSKKLNPWPPKPLNIDIGQSFPTSGSIESFKKSRSTATLLLSIFANIDKSNVAE